MRQFFNHNDANRRPAAVHAAGRFFMVAALCFAAWVTPLAAQPGDWESLVPVVQSNDQAPDIGPMRAAQIAKSRYGGKVLKIDRQGSLYRVKLLLPEGEVKSVFIDASGN